MTNQFNFSQVIKNKKVWAVAAVAIAIAAVADSIGSEYAEYYEPNYGYSQGQVNPYSSGGGNYYPNSGGSYPMNPSYVPNGASSYPLPSAQPAMQPTFNPQQQMNNWQQNQLRQEQNHQQFIKSIYE